MPASPQPVDNNALHPPTNLQFLYQRHRSRLQGFDNLNLKPIPTENHESSKGRRESYGGDKLHRIYPREWRGKKAGLRSTPSPHPVTSPFLNALGSTANTTAEYTSHWARSLPFFNPSQNTSGSPPISMMGPRDASNNHIAASSSPPGVRAASHPSQYSSFGGRQPRLPAPNNRDRRSSMYSQFGQSPYSNIPMPHEDQAHFHPGGLPDLDSLGVPANIHPDAGIAPGERGYCCSFDTLAHSGHGPSVSSENVLLVGYEGGLRVYRFGRKHLDIVGQLDGLRGGVISAKILPWTFRHDPGSSGRPYVAVVVHGPIDPIEADSTGSSDAAGSDDTSNSPQSGARNWITHYQTTVEIYSLSAKSKYVATIFSSPRISANQPFPPPPSELQIDAKGKFLTVVSGVSGEVFVFSPFTRDENVKELESIRCIGKFWTSTHLREIKLNSSPVNSDPNAEEEYERKRVSLFSLSHRWLAVVPPSVDASFSLKGTALLSSTTEARPPGLVQHAPPGRPVTTAGIDIPDKEGRLFKAGREGLQVLHSGASWVGEQGLQAWNNYWKQPQNPSHPPYALEQPSRQEAFPPTHGHSMQSSTTGTPPGQVSIFDLQRLLDAEVTKVKNVLTPLATFEPKSGCSFVSFAPNGLLLLTASKKGDQYTVWNLMKMQYPRTGNTLNPSLQPHVIQSWNFSRMTVSSVVDVVWAPPHGQRLALLTEKGTIHFHELPTNAFSWPPLRRARRHKNPPKQDFDETFEAKSSHSKITSAIGDAVNETSTWLKSMNIRPRSIGSTQFIMTPGLAAGVGVKTAKSTITKGARMVVNSANTIYHSNDNKLHMASLTNGLRIGLMHWLTGRDSNFFAVVCLGTLNIYSVKQAVTQRKGLPPLISCRVGKSPVEFPLHRVPDDMFAPAFRAKIEIKSSGDNNNKQPSSSLEEAVGGTWHLRAPSVPHAAGNGPGIVGGAGTLENWHALVEAETNPPYQPFHTDRRVSLSNYFDPEAMPSVPGKDASEDEWERYYGDVEKWENETFRPWLSSRPHYTTTMSMNGIAENVDEGSDEQWIFGDDIPSQRFISSEEWRLEFDDDSYYDNHDLSTTNTSFNNNNQQPNLIDGLEDSTGGANIENKITVLKDVAGDQVIVTTVRRRGREREEFFEDGVEVVEFVDERV